MYCLIIQAMARDNRASSRLEKVQKVKVRSIFKCFKKSFYTHFQRVMVNSPNSQLAQLFLPTRPICYRLAQSQLAQICNQLAQICNLPNYTLITSICFGKHNINPSASPLVPRLPDLYFQSKINMFRR